MADHYNVNPETLRDWQNVPDGWAIEADDPNDPLEGVKLIKEYDSIEAEDLRAAIDEAFRRLASDGLDSGLSGPRRLSVTAEPPPDVPTIRY